MYNDRYKLYEYIDKVLGKICFTRDLVHFTFNKIDSDIIDYELEKMKENELIIEPLPSVFYNRIKIDWLNDFYVPSYKNILEAYAVQNRWNVVEHVNHWLNSYGLSTQVPARYEYYTTGPTTNIEIFKTIAVFEHSDEPIITYGTKYTAGLYFVMDYLGEDYFKNPLKKEWFIRHIGELKKYWLSDGDTSFLKYMKPWMVKICERIVDIS